MSCTYVVGRFNHPNYGNLAPSNRLSKRLVVVKTVFCKLLRCYWFPNLAAVKKLRMHLSGVVSPKALPPEVYRPTLIDGFMKPKGLPQRPGCLLNMLLRPLRLLQPQLQPQVLSQVMFISWSIQPTFRSIEWHLHPQQLLNQIHHEPLIVHRGMELR